MGSALCRLLAESGHGVWGLDVKPGENTAWRAIQADITSAASLEAALELVRAEAGRLDGIVHTAGVYDLNSLVEMPEDDFIRDFNVNLFGMFRVNRLFFPLLGPNSRIVVISSELAPLDPLPFAGLYAVTKAAVEKYAASLRMEVQLLGHQVIVVRPGAVKTPMLPASTERLARFCAQTRLYPANAARFRRVVDRVEARSVAPERIAAAVARALSAKRPRLVYSVNRNPGLLLMNALPDRLQGFIIRQLLRCNGQEVSHGRD
ncbi:MAG: SDR family oxidoreductase [Clostridia bacterium]|nr:SDR family oxidoreductase [Clostridia bacterium]